MRPIDATVVVVTWNGAHLLPACLDAVLDQGAASIVVVDNASTDGTATLLAEAYPRVRVLACRSNTGFAGGIARALPSVETPAMVWLNNDAVVRPGWLAALTAPLADPAVAASAGKLLLPDGRINSVGGALTANAYGHDIGFGADDDGRWDGGREVAYGCGAAMALRTTAVREIGGVDPRFFLYYEDVELCWRLRLAGYAVRFAPDAVAVHEHSATVGVASLLHTFQTERNRLATVVTCGSAALAARAVLRYPLTTVSVALRESRPKGRARLRAYGSFLTWLPALLRRRRATVIRVSRADVERRWLTLPAD